MREVFEISTTFEKKEDAQNFAEKMLDEKFIACGQISEIESHYVWQEKREIAKEYLLIMKTRYKKLKSLLKALKSTHPYALPEITVKTIVASKEYVNWVIENTK